MHGNRRNFLKLGAGAAAVATATATQANVVDPVMTEMQRRLRYLAAPAGTPPDLLNQPSPPIDPWQPISLDQLRPPVARPLFTMAGPVDPSVLAELKEAVGRDPALNARAGAVSDVGSLAIETLPEDLWLSLFQHRFQKAAGTLRSEGFKIPEGIPWTVQGDHPINGRVRIEIGDAPTPDTHQHFFEHRPHEVFINREVELLWQYHPQYGSGCVSWGYHCICADEVGFSSTRPSSPGPTFLARYRWPILVRRINDLPEIGHQKGHSALRFALPSTTSHLHNAHTASESDGYPGDWLNPGEFWDHHYANFPSGNDEREKLTTLWYHDHRMDFTAANVYAGLDGFYLLRDEQPGPGEPPQTGDFGSEQAGWRLPTGDHDIPLILHDLAFVQQVPAPTRDLPSAQSARRIGRGQSTRWSYESPQDWTDITNRTNDTVTNDTVFLADGRRKAITHAGYATSGEPGKSYSPSPQLVFDGFNTDGILGDRWTVNRRVQPLLRVRARKYRFRLFNGGPSRFYEIFLHATNVPDKQRTAVFGTSPSTTKSETKSERQMLVIAGDGNFQPNPVLVNSIYLGVSQRTDVIIDFSEFGAGSRVYLVNELEQENGRGPTERRIRRAWYATDDDFFKANAIIAFEVEPDPADDQSRIPLVLRELPPVEYSEVKRERLWEFDYDGGLWTINGNIFDPTRIDAGIEQDSAEVWTFRNNGSGWHHPIHSHFTEFIILELDGQPFNQGTIQSALLPPRPGRGGVAPAASPPLGAGAPPVAADPAEAQAQARQRSGAGFSTRKTLTESLGLRRAGPSSADLAKAAREENWAELGQRYWNDFLKLQLTEKLKDDPEYQGQPQKLEQHLQEVQQKGGQMLDSLSSDAARVEILRALLRGRIEEVRFQKIADFEKFTSFLPQVGLRTPTLPDPGRFLGGPRRDIALLLPGTELKVFMRWKDFLGRHVMHCHNVVHEDHAMMVRWDIVPAGHGFDTPREAATVARVGDRIDPQRRRHIESHPAKGQHQPDDS